MAQESISFDRLASVYDETRGGVIRGEGFARDLMTWVRGPRILEIGVGTGAVALPLSEKLGTPVFGIDLSRAMLDRARERLGPIVAVGDAQQLPVASGSTDSVLVVWVLQLVSDMAAVMSEIKRVLRPGGRLALVPARGVQRPDDIEAVMTAFYKGLNSLGRATERFAKAGDLAYVIELLEGSGLAVVGQDLMTEQEWDESPIEAAERLEQRTYASILDLDDEQFETVVLPAARALRDLPEAHLPRRRANRHRLIRCERR